MSAALWRWVAVAAGYGLGAFLFALVFTARREWRRETDRSDQPFILFVGTLFWPVAIWPVLGASLGPALGDWLEARREARVLARRQRHADDAEAKAKEEAERLLR